VESTPVVEPVEAGRPPAVDEPPAPVEPAGSPAGSRPRPWLLRPVGLVAAVVVLAGLGLAGARAWLGTGDGGLSPVATTQATAAAPSTRATTTTSAPTLPVLTGNPRLNASERKLLGRIPTFFSSQGRCHQVGEPDPRDIQPGPPVTANLECTYRGGSIVRFSLFPSDSEMHSFFDDRLRGRDLRRGQGTPGRRAPWQLDHCDAPERGTGRVYGNRNTERPVDPVRSEVGWIRDGYAMYAYAYRPDGDFAAMYDWWKKVYGPVDAYRC
jgi:hypothetical protein